MARGIAIRSIVTLEDNRVEVSFSAGSPTAPVGQSGSFVFGSLAKVQESIKELEKELSDEQLMRLHLAITWLQANGSFGSITPVLNKELRFDTTAPQPLRIV